MSCLIFRRLLIPTAVAALELGFTSFAMAGPPPPEPPSDKVLALPWLAEVLENQEADLRYDPPLGPASPEGNWWAGFQAPGFNGLVRCAVEFRGDLVVAGDFTAVGSVPVFKVARWDGEAWHDMGFQYAGIVASMAVYENDLLVSGGFSRFNSGTRVLRFDGTDWTIMGGPLHDYFPIVTDIETYGDMLLIAGLFTSHRSSSGFHELRNIARWDGSDWAPMVQGEGEDFIGFDAPVYSLTQFEGDLIAGGVFESYGGDGTIAGVARWNGAGWDAIGDSQGRSGTLLTVHDGKLCAGTSESRDGVWYIHLSQWDGAVWTDIADEVGSLSALTSWDGNLLASATFGENPTDFLYDWNGASWEPWQSATDGTIYQFLHQEAALVAVGDFYEAGSQAAVGLARFDNDQWAPFGDQTGEGTTSYVHALAVHEGMLVAAGSFDRAGTQRVNNVARWDGSTWTPMGEGLPVVVDDLCIAQDGNLYAAGGFVDAGPDHAAHAARWDGEAWRGLGTGPLLEPFDSLDRIVPFQGGLIGLSKYTADVLHVWDGAGWSTLASPPELEDAEIQAIGTYGNRLVVTGKLAVSNGGSFPDLYVRVYTYDGSEWADLEYPFTPRDVNTVQEVDGKLFLGTSKSYGLEGEPYYTGSEWRELPVNPHVEHAQVFGWVSGSLVVAGSFDYDWDQSDVLGIARLEGDTWLPLGDFRLGVFLPVLEDLAVFDGDLYVGGRFSQVNGQGSNSIARLLDASVPVKLVNVGAARVEGGAEIYWEVASSADLAGFHVYRQDGDERVQVTDQLLIGSVRYRYLDRNAPPEQTAYWIREHDRAGETEWHGPIPLSAISAAVLAGASPNPFRASTSVQFELAQETTVTARIFDIRGRTVRTLLDGARMPSGRTRLDWLGNDDNGRTLPAGVYFYVIKTSERKLTGRLVRVP